MRQARAGIATGIGTSPAAHLLQDVIEQNRFLLRLDQLDQVDKLLTAIR